MALTSDPFQWCDSSCTHWPRGWQSAFGRRAFTYVAGLPQVFLHHDISDLTTMTELLVTPNAVDPTTYSEAWWALFPNSGPYPANVGAALEDLDMLAIKDSTALLVAQYKPVSFAKAYVALASLERFRVEKEGRGKLQGRAELRLAVFRIVNLDAIGQRLDDLELETMIETLGINKTLWTEMCLGYPTTHETTLRVANFIQNHTSEGERRPGPLRIQAYDKRTQIRDVVSELTGEPRQEIEMRPAGREPLDILTPP